MQRVAHLAPGDDSREPELVSEAILLELVLSARSLAELQAMINNHVRSGYLCKADIRAGPLG